MGALGLIGGGLMGTALIKGLLKQGYPADTIYVAEPDPSRRQLLAELGVELFADSQGMLGALTRRKADGVILAVKPQNVPEAVAGLNLAGLPLLSIVAGYKVAALEALLPAGTKVLRAMPNTPALIGAGITALALGAESGTAEQAWAEKILRSLGRVVLVPESLMDAVTGLSGSGPAYVYLLIEALIDGGVLAGLPRTLARSWRLPRFWGVRGWSPRPGNTLRSCGYGDSGDDHYRPLCFGRGGLFRAGDEGCVGGSGALQGFGRKEQVGPHAGQLGHLSSALSWSSFSQTSDEQRANSDEQQEEE